MRNTYFDNSATSFPKAPDVAAEMARYINATGGPYGRSSYKRAFAVSQTVEECRELLAMLINAEEAERVVFTHNATHAINMVLSGLQLRNRKILISPMEHNAVMRPLHYLHEKHNCTIEVLPSFNDGCVDCARLHEVDTTNAALTVICHTGNVNGVIQPVAQIKQVLSDVPMLVDAAQSAGHTAVDVQSAHIDFLALTGHKGLLGPTGTGALYIAPTQELPPFIRGGTGSNSESAAMPEYLPDMYEAGTPNIAGIYGLRAALHSTVQARHSRKQFLACMDACGRIPGLTVYRADENDRQGKLFSLQIDNEDIGFLAARLYNNYGIEARVGFHCAPQAHTHLHTMNGGTLRISPSVFHTEDDFNYLLHALSQSCNK